MRNRTEIILKANEMMIESYLNNDYIKMDMCRILLNVLIDKELKTKRNKYETETKKG